MDLRGRSLLKEIDFSAEEFRYLVDLGAEIDLLEQAAPAQVHGCSLVLVVKPRCLDR